MRRWKTCKSLCEPQAEECKSLVEIDDERREEEVYSGLDLFVRQSFAGIFSTCATMSLVFQELFVRTRLLALW